jgi:hypothetical protein
MSQYEGNLTSRSFSIADQSGFVRSVRFNVRFGSFADIRTAKLAVRFVP